MSEITVPFSKAMVESRNCAGRCEVHGAGVIWAGVGAVTTRRGAAASCRQAAGGWRTHFVTSKHRGVWIGRLVPGCRALAGLVQDGLAGHVMVVRRTDHHVRHTLVVVERARRDVRDIDEVAFVQCVDGTPDSDGVASEGHVDGGGRRSRRQ